MAQAPDRAPSVSPANGMNGVSGLHRQASDYYMNAMNGGMAAVPAHLRTEMQPSPRSQSPAQYPMPGNNNNQQQQQQHRPSLTSNPSSGGYNPPQILEPPTNNGQQQSGSGTNSPHLTGALPGWQSPHNGLGGNQQNDYAYPDPNSGYNNVNAAQMYYSQQGVQRPHSTGPMDYHNQLRGQELWAQHQQ